MSRMSFELSDSKLFEPVRGTCCTRMEPFPNFLKSNRVLKCLRHARLSVVVFVLSVVLNVLKRLQTEPSDQCSYAFVYKLCMQLGIQLYTQLPLVVQSLYYRLAHSCTVEQNENKQATCTHVAGDGFQNTNCAKRARDRQINKPVDLDGA